MSPRKMILSAVVSVVMLILLMVPAVFAERPNRGGYIIMTTGRLASLNPLHNDTNVGNMTGQVFASLTRLGKNNEILPYLAKSWEISSDGLTYTFHLEEDAVFHDGKPITAEDVKFSLEIVQKTHRFGSKMFGPVTKIETPDEQTVVLRLSQTHAPVLLSTSFSRFLPIMPKHVYGTGEDFTTHPAHKNPVGSGPFKIQSANLSEHVTMVRHDGYFLKGKPYLDKVILRIITDPTAIRLALRKGDLHIGGPSRFRDLKDLRGMNHIELTPAFAAQGGMCVVEFNNRKGPLSNKKVRQAIGYAVDLNYITKELHDGWTVPGRGAFPSKNPFFNDNIKGYDFDPEKANQLLDEAGYPRKADGMRFELRLLYFTAFFQDLLVVIPDVMVPSLKNVGIKVVRDVVPGPTDWARKMAQWDFDMSMSIPGAFLDPEIGITRLYATDNIKHIPYANTSGYSNKQVDDLFTRAAREFDFDKRKELYDEAQLILWDEQPMFWATEIASPMVYHKNLVNLPMHGWLTQSPFDEMYWKIEK